MLDTDSDLHEPLIGSASSSRSPCCVEEEPPPGKPMATCCGDEDNFELPKPNGTVIESKKEHPKQICPHWSIRSRHEAKSARPQALDGDKMKIDHFDVLLSNESEKPYIGGETVQGQIEISVCKKVLIAQLTVKLLGTTQTGWRNKNSEQVYESNEQVLNECIDLTRVIADHCDEKFYLKEGLHNICFQAPLPLDVISSIEKENHGWVRYSCIATLEIPEDGDSELIAERNFSVVSMLNLDAPYMRQPTSSREESDVVGCCCKRKIGLVSAQMIVEEMGVLPGEIVKITLTVENNVKKKNPAKHKDIAHECVLISLCQQLDFVSQNRYELHLYDRKSLTIAVESHGTCKATPGSGPETKYIDFTIPHGLQPTSTKANGLITISYFFKLDMDTFDVIVPVIVGSLKTPGPV